MIPAHKTSEKTFLKLFLLNILLQYYIEGDVYLSDDGQVD